MRPIPASEVFSYCREVRAQVVKLVKLSLGQGAPFGAG
jgi:hypothetical protein